MDGPRWLCRHLYKNVEKLATMTGSSPAKCPSRLCEWGCQCNKEWARSDRYWQQHVLFQIKRRRIVTNWSLARQRFIKTTILIGPLLLASINIIFALSCLASDPFTLFHVRRHILVTLLLSWYLIEMLPSFLSYSPLYFSYFVFQLVPHRNTGFILFKFAVLF